MNDKEIVNIEEPNLVEFVKTIEKYVKDGYSVEDTNAGVPSQFGWGLYVCQVAKPKASEQPKPASEPKSTEQTTESVTTEVDKPAPKRKTTRRKSTKSTNTSE